MAVAFDPQLGDPRLQIQTAMRSGQRLADSRSHAHDSCPAARVSFPTSISPGPRAACQHRNSAAYLVDFTAPTARYTAKFVASVASQIRRIRSLRFRWRLSVPLCISKFQQNPTMSRQCAIRRSALCFTMPACHPCRRIQSLVKDQQSSGCLVPTSAHALPTYVIHAHNNMAEARGSRRE